MPAFEAAFVGAVSDIDTVPREQRTGDFGGGAIQFQQGEVRSAGKSPGARERVELGEKRSGVPERSGAGATS